MKYILIILIWLLNNVCAVKLQIVSNRNTHNKYNQTTITLPTSMKAAGKSLGQVMVNYRSQTRALTAWNVFLGFSSPPPRNLSASESKVSKIDRNTHKTPFPLPPLCSSSLFSLPLPSPLFSSQKTQSLWDHFCYHLGNASCYGFWAIKRVSASY